MCSSDLSDSLLAALGAVSYILFQLLILRLRLTNPVAVYSAAILSLWITIGITVCLARSLRHTLVQVTVLVASAIVTLPFVLLPLVRISSHAQLAASQRLYNAYAMAFHTVPGLRGLLLIAFAVSLGVVVARLFREMKLLLPIALVLALIDLYVVFGGGLVAQANSGKSPAAAAAMRSLTVPLTPRVTSLAAPPPVMVGFADFLFIALFFACFVRFRVPAGRTFAVLCGILALYMLVVIVGHIDLPALVPIAVVVVGCNLGEFRYARDEAFAMLYAGLIVVGVLGALVFLSHR